MDWLSLRENVGINNMLVIKFKQSLTLLNMSFKLTFTKVSPQNKNKENTLWLDNGGIKKWLTINTLENLVR